MDINRIITESISDMVNDTNSQETASEVKDDLTTGTEEKAVEHVKKISDKAVEFAKENPKAAAATAAALAAGLGAVALRKKLAALAKSSNKKNVNNQ